MAFPHFLCEKTMMQTIPRTPKTPFFDAQTTLDLFAAPTVPPRTFKDAAKRPAPMSTKAPTATAADTSTPLDLTPEPPFSIAADHYAALAKKA